MNEPANVLTAESVGCDHCWHTHHSATSETEEGNTVTVTVVNKQVCCWCRSYQTATETRVRKWEHGPHVPQYSGGVSAFLIPPSERKDPA